MQSQLSALAHSRPTERQRSPTRGLQGGTKWLHKPKCDGPPTLIKLESRFAAAKLLEPGRWTRHGGLGQGRRRSCRSARGTGNNYAGRAGFHAQR